ncbi:hypothetical protein KIN20_029500 [Parelaphostrongylus tenuis]|uniref:Uncharacterized protein n=1 Tax=Parelaphostrongylus tenuis TaxID=148309 RepID=A0AAD5WFN6_PARTN|nr:hypothetical protein KIN20_029500 [Parelaphostrongylus tenuis]
MMMDAKKRSECTMCLGIRIVDMKDITCFEPIAVDSRSMIHFKSRKLDCRSAKVSGSVKKRSLAEVLTLKIIRFHETGKLNWIAMIDNALDTVPPPKIMPDFLRTSGLLSDCQIDVMKAHEHANHFAKELDENGEFIDQRKEQREKMREFQLVDYFERRRNARF